jgi:hypothetical protein
LGTGLQPRLGRPVHIPKAVAKPTLFHTPAAIIALISRMDRLFPDGWLKEYPDNGFVRGAALHFSRKTRRAPVSRAPFGF